MMRKMRKIMAVLLTMIMVFAMSANVLAANITITGGAEGSEYAAYQLLNVTHAEAGVEGDDADDKFAYTLNEKYTAVLQSVTDKTEQADILAYIQGLTAAEDIRRFADEVYAEIKAADPAITADYTTNADKFADVAQGYYLIAETTVGNAADTYSLVMLDTAGKNEITVKTKEDVPTVDKEVKDVNDSTGEASWGDSADHDLGDVIEYEITGTVSAKYADYESYYYSFHDEMVPGLTLNADSIKVTINGVDVTEQFAVTTEVKEEDGHKDVFTATSNLKEITGVTINADTKVIVTYTATLNEYAVIGAEGNVNRVVLDYENDPYHKADGDNNPLTPNKPEVPGKTPEDVNIVFTYEVSVDKVDKDGKELEGAGFTLYKWIANAETEGTWVAVGEEVKDVTTFEYKRLDEGKYKLVETTVPAGYNQALDVEFEIVSDHDATDDETHPVELKDLVVNYKDADGNDMTSKDTDAAFTVTLAEGKVETDIVNLAGFELPSTGGIGTTIFYVAGAILVIGAAVVLVTRKRMDV